MECKPAPFEFLCESFPQIDIRLIKATVLEHGDDVESAIDFLMDTSDQNKDASGADVFKHKYLVARDGKLEQQGAISPCEVNKERDFAEMQLELPKEEQTRDLLSLIGAHTVMEFGHKDQQVRDLLSLVGAPSENEAGKEETPVLDNVFNGDNKSSQSTVASVGDYSFDDRKALFSGKKLFSPLASTSSSIIDQFTSASDQMSSVSSSDWLRRCSKTVCVNGGCIEEHPTVHTSGGKEVISQGHNSNTWMSSPIGQKGTGLCDMKCDQADFLRDLCEIDNVSHSCPEDGSALGTITSNPCQNVCVGILEDIVQEARTDKEFLMQLIDTISTLWAKADQENIAAQRSKIDAVRGGHDILVKAKEMRKQITKMREDNLMHAGEIYGEKAVLGTEARELRSRLEQLKLQKDQAVATLGEIQTALEARLNMALEERERAEVEKKLKEENALKILVMEEALLTTVIKESRDLEIEAEACAQLRGFLMEHGSIVDSLQGEMGVLCEDVESFKKQVEEGMWSAVSMISFPSGVTPEGPYSFRRSNRSSSSSNEELGLKILHGIHPDGKFGAQTSSKKEWNEESLANDCTYLYGSLNHSFSEGSIRDPTIDFVPSVHAELEPSFNPIMPEPSFDMSKIKGREYDLDVEVLKSVAGSDGDMELDIMGNNSPNCWDRFTNNAYDIREPVKQLVSSSDMHSDLSNSDMYSDLDKLSFQHAAANSPSHDTRTPVYVPNKPSSEKGSMKESSSSFKSQSDDNDWDILCMEP